MNLDFDLATTRLRIALLFDLNPRSWVVGRRWSNRLPTMESLMSVIDRRLSGATWTSLAISEGFGPQQTNNLQGTVYTRLRKMGRTDLIAQLWPRRVPMWLTKR